MAECPFCNKKIISSEEGCPSCGYNYRGKVERTNSNEIFGEARELDSQVIFEETKKKIGMGGGAFGTGDSLPLWLKIALVLATIFAGRLFGFVVSLYLIFGGKPEHKPFGRKLLYLTIFLIFVRVIAGFLGGMFYILSSGLGLGVIC